MFRLAVMVKVMMSLAIFLSYALQFYVPVDIINSYLADRVPTENRSSGENFTVSFIADKKDVGDLSCICMVNNSIKSLLCGEGCGRTWC